MQEIVKVNLDNEMDLILAHKRTMKLSELCGLSIPAQTTFATAVSEIARSAIGQGKKSYLALYIDTPRVKRKDIVAILYDQTDLSKLNKEAFSYASRLAGDLEKVHDNGWYQVILRHQIPFAGTMSQAKIEGFLAFFKNEPPLSPYDEIRKKNIQLIEMSDKLRMSDSQYRILTDSLPLVMFATDHNGDIVYANKGLKDFLDNPDALPVTAWRTLLHPDDHTAVSSGWNKALMEKTPFRAEGRLKYKDKYIWHLITIVPVKDDKKPLVNWNGFFVDIQLQKQIEETLKDNKELKKAQLELERYQHELEDKVEELNVTNHNLEQFAYIASHDLQEPLRKINTYTSILEKLMTLTPEQKHYFEKIVSSSERMTVLINDVLNYSRLSNKNEKITLVDLHGVIEQVISDFDLVIKEKNAKVTLGEIPSVVGLPLQFSQLFSNLMSNALKFSDKKVPEIRISSRHLSAAEIRQHPQLKSDSSYDEVTFSDNGIGFDQKYSEKVFVIFQRLMDRTYEGTGIGLALCKKIIENHGGAISAEGKVGEGATFHIYLPVEE